MNGLFDSRLLKPELLLNQFDIVLTGGFAFIRCCENFLIIKRYRLKNVSLSEKKLPFEVLIILPFKKQKITPVKHFGKKRLFLEGY